MFHIQLIFAYINCFLTLASAIPFIVMSYFYRVTTSTTYEHRKIFSYNIVFIELNVDWKSFPGLRFLTQYINWVEWNFLSSALNDRSDCSCRDSQLCWRILCYQMYIIVTTVGTRVVVRKCQMSLWLIYVI